MGTLWWNGTFFTMERENEKIDAVYVEDGIIKATGKKENLSDTYQNKITEEYDLQGAFVYPGFVDSHLHMVGHGEKLIQLDLSETTSSENMRQLLKGKVKSLSNDEWVLGEGWNENNFIDRKIFHRDELDEIAPNQPMFLTRICRHAALVNSAALKLAGITKDTPNPEGGLIVRDLKGEPTGYLLDAAMDLVKSSIPSVTNDYVTIALQKAVDDMLRLGLVGGHTEDLHYYNGFKQTLTSFTSVIDGDKRKFRAHLLVHHEASNEMVKEGYMEGEVTPFIELGAMKIFADGALGGRTAWLSTPYADDPSTSGVAMHSEEQLMNLVEKARQLNMNVAIHTIGDAALDMALRAIEGFPANKGRDRLIHVQVIRPDLLRRLKKLPVILDIQPRFVASDFPWVQERLGEERLKYSFAWKTLLQEGIHCAGGSDAPIEPVDPLLGIHAAVTRTKPGERHPGYLPEQKLTPFEAVQLFTSGSATAINKESQRGKISSGFVADFTILDKNLFVLEPEEILQTNVLMTVVDNTVMYQR
ncbi:amidohydrolase [Halalkalibacter urbisdiaboli]|uniref:amidohydrolase n=1 Tax=Halalkalibacter urbisdiaboli TaxID=1960589 RepID=UPI000B438A3D|nr:amidohydrolase [Halalkalibacter urbisdiaboli]